MVSTQGDIYSYGILVLETVTGRKPTDSNFTRGLSLREYVELGLNGGELDVVDTQHREEADLCSHLCSRA
jgi:serine/threonine protein kinase